MYRLVLCIAALLCLSQAEELDTASAAGRILGGTAAPIERYPYTVQVFRSIQFWCGGILLSQNHVLSAAHCFTNATGGTIDQEDFSIRAGSAFISLDSEGQTRSVSRIVIHENFNPVNLDSDLAVLLLNQSLSLNLRVQPAVLATPALAVPDGTFLTAVGWGTTRDVAVTEVLKDVMLRKVNMTECAEAYENRANYTGAPYNVTDNMICAGWPGLGGFGQCFGDSGGPLILTTGSSQVVVGMTSWGPTNQCGHPVYMGVSVRLSGFNQWVQTTMANLRNGAPSLFISPVVQLTTLLASLIIYKDF